MISDNPSSLITESNNKNRPKILSKKTKRSNFKNTKKKKNYKLPSPSPMHDTEEGKKTVYPSIRKKKKLQPKINDFFENTKSQNGNIKNSLNENNLLNNNDDTVSIFNYKSKKYVKKIKKNKIKKNSDEKKNPNNINNCQNNNNNENNNISCEEKKISNINNTFSHFFNLINNYKEENKDLFDDNYFIKKNIFNKSEIIIAMKIQKEFYQKINNLSSDIDRKIKATIFFIDKGFSELIRYNYYKCLINYGFPSLEKFNIFYNNIISDCEKIKIETPEKMLIEFYTEYVFHLLRNEQISKAENKLISEFFFNGEDIDIIKNNLNCIETLKENQNNIRNYIQNYLEINYNKLFKEIDISLDKHFSKAKAIICRILSNIISECDKNGYLNYKKIICDDDIVFDGIKIKGNPNMQINFRKMISFKIFGQELSEKKFNILINEYLLKIFSNFLD